MDDPTSYRGHVPTLQSATLDKAPALNVHPDRIQAAYHDTLSHPHRLQVTAPVYGSTTSDLTLANDEALYSLPITEEIDDFWQIPAMVRG